MGDIDIIEDIRIQYSDDYIERVELHRGRFERMFTVDLYRHLKPNKIFKSLQVDGVMFYNISPVFPEDPFGLHLVSTGFRNVTFSVIINESRLYLINFNDTIYLIDVHSAMIIEEGGNTPPPVQDEERRRRGI